MPSQKSYAEFILGVFRALLVDCARYYPNMTKEFDRDYKRLSSAIDSHGIRFTMDVMPNFRKHLDKCLSERRLTHSSLCHFGPDRKGGTIPRLFRGLILRVFDRSGLLRDQPDITAIKLLRQLLGVVRKLEMAAGLKDQRNAVREFYQIDYSVRNGHLNWDDHSSFAEEVLTNATSMKDICNDGITTQGELLLQEGTDASSRTLRTLLAKVQLVADLCTGEFGSFEPIDWSPKHGPGAVSDQVPGISKYTFSSWSDRLESVFPYADFAVANYACVDTIPIEVARFQGFSKEAPARLHTVPKTIKTPRLIAAEPVSLQWCQQAVRDYFYSRVENTFVHNFVDFRRQDMNGRLALEASRDQSHATIDLSSASDRISCWHVERLFRRSPSLLCALQASRSVWLTQDICRKNPQFHKLRKYSTMGNATTFPVQSLFFLVIALAAVLHVRNMPVTKKSIHSLGKWTVRVFGDDIIVPSDCSELVVRMLETLELKVNSKKTFLEGNFRESCGTDAYGGHIVTTTNVLDMPRSASPGSIVSSVDAHNNLLQAGYWTAAAFVRQTAYLSGYKKIREVKHGTGAFGWLTYGVPLNTGFRTRVNGSLHKPEILTLENVSSSRRTPASGESGLLQFFTEAAKVVTSAKSTLGHNARRPKSRLALRWMPIQ